jgi:hypothetical protein
LAGPQVKAFIILIDHQQNNGPAMEDRPEGTFTTSLSTQKNAVRLELNDQFIEMTTSQFERLIAHLGQVRAEMLPPVPANPSPQQQRFPMLDEFVLATVDDMPATECGARFIIRSAHYGWQAMQVSPECCRMLGEGLLGIDRPSPLMMPESTSVN